MAMNGSVSQASSDFTGIKNITRLASSAASTNATLCTPNQAGLSERHRLYQIIGMVTNTYPLYLKIYDLARLPVVGTDIPLMALPLAAQVYWNGTAAVAAPTPIYFNWADVGYSFQNGIAFAITKNPQDTDNTAGLAGDVTGLNIFWQ